MLLLLSLMLSADLSCASLLADQLRFDDDAKIPVKI
jgi:hypothetical protein